MKAIFWLTRQLIGAAIMGLALFMFLLFCGWMESHPVIFLMVALPTMGLVTVKELMKSKL